MPIDVTCDACQKRFRLSDELAGKRFKCKGCGEVLTATPAQAADPVPAKMPSKQKLRPRKNASPEAPSAEEAPPRRKKKKRPVQESIPDPFIDDYEKEEEEVFDDFGDDYGTDPEDHYEDYGAAPAPKRKKKKKTAKSKGFIDSEKKKTSSGGGLPAMTFNINRINIALIVFGGVLLFQGCREFRLASSAGSAPREISLAEIYENGPGDDVYLTVSGIFPPSDGYVANETRTGRMTEIWYPAVPEVGAGSAKFIVYSTDANTEDDVGSLMASTVQTGMVVNAIKGLDKETKGLLRQNMPGIDLENALIFHSGRTPSGALKYGAFLLGGLVLLLVGLGWIFFLHE